MGKQNDLVDGYIRIVDLKYNAETNEVKMTCRIEYWRVAFWRYLLKCLRKEAAIQGVSLYHPRVLLGLLTFVLRLAWYGLNGKVKNDYKV